MYSNLLKNRRFIKKILFFKIFNSELLNKLKNRFCIVFKMLRQFIDFFEFNNNLQ